MRPASLWAHWDDDEWASFDAVSAVGAAPDVITVTPGVTFPAVPLPLLVELPLEDTLLDVTSSVRGGPNAVITRGRANEQQQVSASTCPLTLNDTAGDFNSRNPRSPYFGRLGRNTPLRVSVQPGFSAGSARDVVDTFSRIVTDTNWGISDSGHSWFGAGSGLSGFNAWSVNGTAGVVKLPANSASAGCYLPDVRFDDYDVTVTFTAPVATGAYLTGCGLGFHLHNTLLVLGFYVEVRVYPGGSVFLHFFDYQTDDVNLDGVVGLLHTGQPLRVRARTAGQRLYVRVWDPVGAEPSDWHMVRTSAQLFAASSLYVFGVAGVGNTNTKPVNLTFDDLRIANVVPRFAGEVASWAPRWDPTGGDVYVPIDGAGILRRLGQGAKPLKSAVRRQYTGAAGVIGYWPMEDGSDATAFASAVAGGNDMAVTVGNSGSVTFASDSASFAGSGALPTVTFSLLRAAIPSYNGAAGRLAFRGLFKIPANPGSQIAMVSVYCNTGGIRRWTLFCTTGGGLILSGFNSAGTQLVTTGTLAAAVAGKSLLIGWSVTGSDYDLYTHQVAADGTITTLSTVGAWATTVSTAYRIDLGYTTGGFDGAIIGHVLLTTDASTETLTSAPIQGYPGEAAIARMTRLCAEEGVPFDATGAPYLAPDDSPAMGPQGQADLVSLLTECAAADQGILYEPRPSLGLAYRSRISLFDQTPALQLTYPDPAAHLSEVPTPVDDDQFVRNDVIARRTSGSSYRAVLDSGPLSTQDPPDGVGTYDEDVTYNVAADTALPDIAGWRRHLGTTDEPRYPTVTVNLARAVFAADQARSGNAFGLDIGDLETIAAPPVWLPPELIELLAQGMTETLSNYQWTIRWNTVPASPYRVGTYDDPDSLWDTAGSQLDADVTSSATSWPVATTTGPVWVSGDVDFDLMCEGERVTVTHIAGTSSPQTFTVVRSVNGITKAHTVGAAVSLFRPVYYG